MTQCQRCCKFKWEWEFGVCGCRILHQTCCQLIKCSFHSHKPCPMSFQRIWQHILLSQPQGTCNQTTAHDPPHLVSSPAWWSQTSQLCSWGNTWLVQPVNFCSNYLREAQLRAYRPLGGSWPDSSFDVVSDLNGQKRSSGGVLSRMKRPSVPGRWQTAWMAPCGQAACHVRSIGHTFYCKYLSSEEKLHWKTQKF